MYDQIEYDIWGIWQPSYDKTLVNKYVTSDYRLQTTKISHHTLVFRVVLMVAYHVVSVFIQAYFESVYASHYLEDLGIKV